MRTESGEGVRSVRTHRIQYKTRAHYSLSSSLIFTPIQPYVDTSTHKKVEVEAMCGIIGTLELKASGK